MEQLAGDALGLLDHLDIDRASVMGCSMGGMVAQMLAARHPQRVDRLVLTATACYMPKPEVWDERIDAVRKGGMASVADGTIDRWFTAPGQACMPKEVAAVKAIVASTPAEGFCACSAAIRDMDQRDSITGITAPTLIIVGELDPGTPVSAAEAIHERIAGSKLLVIPNAAHFVHMECADEFNAAVMGFLNL
jgi:3-oxoadipate enol-lactonase